MERTLKELQYKQALPLEIKVKMTKNRIREWVKEFGVNGVYVSFSGGKDSTVLLHIVREIYPTIPAVFIDTGLEYPEIRDFVKTFDNVEWVKPKMNFKQVINRYGYPFISKEVSDKVHCAKLNPHGYAWGALHGKKQGMWDFSKWAYLLDAPFEISADCCRIMKKTPAKRYERKTGRKPIVGTMAQESKVRTTQWLQHGCNAFDKKRQISTPMAFWTEKDVLRYIKRRDIKIASVYGEIVYVDTCGNEYDNVICEEYADIKATGVNRTGCMFCGYGCHLEKGKGRFELMKETHPKQYEYIMKPWKDGGLNYKEIIDWMNENGNLNIRY